MKCPTSNTLLPVLVLYILFPIYIPCSDAAIMLMLTFILCQELFNRKWTFLEFCM